MRGIAYGLATLALTAPLGTRATAAPDTASPRGGATAAQTTAWSASGGMSAIRKQRQVVVRDQKAFAALWREHTNSPKADNAPTVDFSKYDVVGYWAGEKPTGGFSVTIGGVSATRRSATVHVAVTRPDPRAMVIQMVTYPFALKAVPKLPASVRFDVREAVKAQPAR